MQTRLPVRVWSVLLLAAAVLTLALGGLRHASADGQPSFRLPWQDGVTWYTGEAGFHATNDAIDFFPPDTGFSESVRCVGDPDWVFQESTYWVLASAPGTVVDEGEPYVTLDHGGGWFSRYYHLSDHQVALGDVVQAGQRLGHPSTLGDCSSGPHVHFWVQGPGGQTTRSVTLSGVPTTGLDINEPHSATGNYDTANLPTPTPTAASTDTPTPTPAPTHSPTSSPTPQVFAAGDANCDGLVTPADAVIILQVAAGIDLPACMVAHAETNCDGVVTPADAIAVLEMTFGDTAQPVKAACESPAPTVAPSPTSAQTAGPSATPSVVVTARPTATPSG